MRRQVVFEPEFDAWREAAREALREGFSPAQIDFRDASVARGETLAFGLEPAADGPPVKQPHVPRAFMELGRIAAAHRDGERWNLLYRLLWRLQENRSLLHIEVDPDVARLLQLRAQVQRDLHKMHAFLRFRRIDDEPERYVAWYQPDHHILTLAAPFFVERFGVHAWAILTPDASVRWEPDTRQLAYGAGVSKEEAPAENAMEELWRSYYSSIFNPARLNPTQMRQEMPLRYWKNLPEAAVIPHLMQKAATRVETMIETQKSKPSAEPFVPEEHSLTAIREALPGCRGCPLYQFATQAVPGRGARKAHLMLVGEQPGDQEDLQGQPFVGPAGGVLRRVLDELRIHADDVYLTNAVKHFKFKEAGKRRLHENPRMSEINACKPWLSAEMDAVKPRVVLCLGASAAKSLLGGTFALMKQRGQLQQTPEGTKVFATIHPSAVLRARDEESRHQLLAFLKQDLSRAYQESLKQ